MRFMSLEQDIRTLYVSEDYIHRLSMLAETGELFPEALSTRTYVDFMSDGHLRIDIGDRAAARRLRFNRLEVWRVDRQTIHYRVRYRPGRRERMREIVRCAPSPPAFAIMLPVIAVLAFIAPEILLMPVFGLVAVRQGDWYVMHPLAKRLKAVADIPAFEQRRTQSA